MKEAEQAWERNGRIAAWGCRWFQVWKEKVEEAVRQEQTLKVVFFPGQVGQGKSHGKTSPQYPTFGTALAAAVLRSAKWPIGHDAREIWTGLAL